MQVIGFRVLAGLTTTSRHQKALDSLLDEFSYAAHIRRGGGRYYIALQSALAA